MREGCSLQRMVRRVRLGPRWCSRVKPRIAVRTPGRRWMTSVALLLPTLPACSDSQSVVGETAAEAVIYGDDDRMDAYLVEDEPLRQVALQSTLALVREDDVRRARDGTLAFDTVPLGRRQLLCPGERFADQPTLAACAGVLVDADLLLTAAHCLDQLPCERQLWSFDYALSGPAAPIVLRETNLYRCRRVALRGAFESAGEPGSDYAMVQLNRTVTPERLPARATTFEIAPEQQLAVVGYPSGTPLKVDQGAFVLDARASERDYFVLVADTFGGSSGSGVFDVVGNLVGTVVEGGVDYLYQPEQRCFTARRIDEPDVGAQSGELEEPSGSGERAVHAAKAIAALCRTGWRSTALCGTAAICGDGQCSIEEHDGRCADDCVRLDALRTPKNQSSSGCSTAAHELTTVERGLPMATLLLLVAPAAFFRWHRLALRGHDSV